MSSLREAFKDGEIPAELVPHISRQNNLLNGEWTLIKDNRSSGLTEITDFFGLDVRDRTAWEFSQHLSAVRMRLEYTHSENGKPQLKIVCHGAIIADCPRAIVFDGEERKGVPISEVVPHPPLLHMTSGVDEGAFLAAEIDGILFVKYQTRKGTFYMTRVLLERDPEGTETGPITLAQYCVVKSNGEKHVALRYHKKL